MKLFKSKEKNEKFIKIPSKNKEVFLINDENIDEIQKEKDEDCDKKPKKSIGSNLYAGFEEYCANSTLHGLKYIGDEKLYYAERVFWLFAFFGGIAFACYFITTLYTRFDESPIITTFSTTPVDISAIPFPTITICNNNIYRSNVLAVYLADKVQKKVVSDICDNKLFYFIEDEYRNYTDEDLFKHLMTGTHPCDVMIHEISWKNKVISPRDRFNFIVKEVVDNRICCKFNFIPYLKSQTLDNDYMISWNLEDGYGENNETLNRHVMPFRANQDGIGYGVSLKLFADVDSYHCLHGTYSSGFRIILSNTLEIPKITDGFLVSPDYITKVIMEPIIKDSEPRVMEIRVDKRQCYFNNEKILKYFSTYTQNNCKLECIGDFTVKNCQCLPLPITYANYVENKTNIYETCFKQPRHVECLHKATIYMQNEGQRICKCYPGCYEISYIPTVVSAGKYITDTKKDNSSFGNVELFYIKSKFTKSTKTVIYGFSEFLSNTGGLLGLFLGFSFLSFIEISYYLTLRLMCNYYKVFNIEKKESVGSKQDKIFK